MKKMKKWFSTKTRDDSRAMKDHLVSFIVKNKALDTIVFYLFFFLIYLYMY